MNFFGRGRAARPDAQGHTVEMGPPSMPAQAETQQTSSWGFRRSNIFTSRNDRDGAGRTGEGPPQHVAGTGNPDDSPKTPRFQFTGLQLPWAREAGHGNEPHHHDQPPRANHEPVPGRRTDLDARPLPAIPQPTASGHGHGHDEAPRRFSGPDPAEQRLAQLADDGRRRTGGRRRARLARGERPQPGPRPKHFMFCLPWIESRRTRMLILQSFVSGIFSAALLSTCELPFRRIPGTDGG